jgi:hypothetical protein
MGSWSAARPDLTPPCVFDGAYAACYVVFIVTGRAAARLARDFRALGAAANRLGPLPILGLRLLAALRPISIAAFAGVLRVRAD